MIGTTWTDAKGRVWQVRELVQPGRYLVATECRTRVGEMYAKDIRAAIARATLRASIAKAAARS